MVTVKQTHTQLITINTYMYLPSFNESSISRPQNYLHVYQLVYIHITIIAVYAISHTRTHTHTHTNIHANSTCIHINQDIAAQYTYLSKQRQRTPSYKICTPLWDSPAVLCTQIHCKFLQIYFIGYTCTHT